MGDADDGDAGGGDANGGNGDFGDGDGGESDGGGNDVTVSPALLAPPGEYLQLGCLAIVVEHLPLRLILLMHQLSVVINPVILPTQSSRSILFRSLFQFCSKCNSLFLIKWFYIEKLLFTV